MFSGTNPCYKDVVQKYSHLKLIWMNDSDEKMELPIYVIIGTSEYGSPAKRNIRIENRREPVAE